MQVHGPGDHLHADEESPGVHGLDGRAGSAGIRDVFLQCDFVSQNYARSLVQFF